MQLNREEREGREESKKIFAHFAGFAVII